MNWKWLTDSIPKGYEIPRFQGLAWIDYRRMEAVTILIPLNFIAGWARYWWHTLIRGPRRSDARIEQLEQEVTDLRYLLGLWREADGECDLLGYLAGEYKTNPSADCANGIGLKYAIRKRSEELRV